MFGWYGPPLSFGHFPRERGQPRPLASPFPLTPGSSPGQALALSHGGGWCKTLAEDRHWFLVRDSYIPCERAVLEPPLRRVPLTERRGRWLSPGWREKACFVDSGWTFRPRE